MRYRNASVIAAALLTTSLAVPLAAQRATHEPTPSPRAWLGFGYETVNFTVNGVRRPAIVIREVPDDSPSQSAGLAVGDTVLSINNIRVTDQFMGSLSVSLAPGDRVNLHIRRNGRERDISVVAAKRPEDENFNRPFTWSYTVTPDNIRQGVRLLLDSALIRLDSMTLPSFRYNVRPNGGVWILGDSSRIEILRDSMGFHFVSPSRNSMWTQFDSTRSSGFWSTTDSTGEARMLFRTGPGSFAWATDSTAALKWRPIQLERGHLYGLRGDSVLSFEGSGPGFAIFGVRAIGGAQLTEVDSNLGEYFGTDHGMLVVRVPDGTPADRAGLEAGDVIVGVNGHDISSMTDLRKSIGGSEHIRLDVIRQKKRRTIEFRE